MMRLTISSVQLTSAELLVPNFNPHGSPEEKKRTSEAFLDNNTWAWNWAHTPSGWCQRCCGVWGLHGCTCPCSWASAPQQGPDFFHCSIRSFISFLLRRAWTSCCSWRAHALYSMHLSHMWMRRTFQSPWKTFRPLLPRVPVVCNTSMTDWLPEDHPSHPVRTLGGEQQVQDSEESLILSNLSCRSRHSCQSDLIWGWFCNLVVFNVDIGQVVTGYLIRILYLYSWIRYSRGHEHLVGKVSWSPDQ